MQNWPEWIEQGLELGLIGDMWVSSWQIQLNLGERRIRIEEALALQTIVNAGIRQLLTKGSGALKPEAPMVRWLFQIFELVGAIIVTKYQP